MHTLQTPACLRMEMDGPHETPCTAAHVHHLEPSWDSVPRVAAVAAADAAGMAATPLAVAPAPAGPAVAGRVSVGMLCAGLLHAAGCAAAGSAAAELLCARLSLQGHLVGAGGGNEAWDDRLQQCAQCAVFAPKYRQRQSGPGAVLAPRYHQYAAAAYCCLQLDAQVMALLVWLH